MIRKLRLKFVCITMVIVSVMMSVIFGLVLHFTRSNLEEQSLQAMQAIADEPFRKFPFDKPGEQVMLPHFVLQLGRGGNVIATGSDYFDLEDTEFLRNMLEIALSSPEESGVIEAYQLRFLRTSGPPNNAVVFADISSETSTMKDLVKSCALIAAASFAAFLFISIFLAWWAVKPVEAAWNQQRQFVADASHELKTPLTVIMTNAELLQNPDYDEPAQERFRGSILTMAHQMRGLVEGLLELARVDNRASRMVFSAIGLSDLVCEGLLPFEPVFFEKGMELESFVEPGIFVQGSGTQLRQVLDILLDNAAKYASHGAQVRVSLRRQGGQCLLAVSNPGEAISREDLKNIFKRFYRIDKARSMGCSYGLGLSIAQSIVGEHRGKIWAESAGGINTFFVQLPAARHQNQARG